MTDTPKPRSGGRILVDALVRHGVRHAFCVAGESYLEVLDALHGAPIDLVTCRQEGGAANMAEAYGKLTGEPGICLVTRGPGACNAAIGVHTAFQDSTPMILLVGQVSREQRDREAFQEVDYRQMFGALAKWAAEIDSAHRIPEYLARAFHVATSGRPGPVVLALPEDMLREVADVADTQPYLRVSPCPGHGDLATLDRMIAAAARPMLLVGGGGWTDRAAADIVAFAESRGLGACCSFRRQDIFDNAHPNYLGDLSTGPHPKLLEQVRAADLLLVVGARLGETTTQGYGLLKPPELGIPLVHVHPDADELGRVYRPTLAIQAGVVQFAAVASARAPDPAPARPWLAAARADYEASTRPEPYRGALDMGVALDALGPQLPEDAVITIDAGNFSGWAHRYIRYRRPMRQLAPTSGAMGYAVPAAVAAAIARPDRLAIAFVGDGGFLMSGQELATAMHHRVAPLFLIFDNGMYGTIRMHQERRFPGRVSATQLTNPDFAALARSYGAHGETVMQTADFLPAFTRARASGLPAVIHLLTDPDLITTRTTLTAMAPKMPTPSGTAP